MSKADAKLSRSLIAHTSRELHSVQMIEKSCNYEEVLESVRNLTKTADTHKNFSSAESQFFQASSKIQVRNLGEWERAIRRAAYHATQSKGRLRFRLMPAGEKFSALWLDLFSGNGFRRENAIRSIVDGAPNAFLFAVLVRRLNDWVEQVRLAAKDAIPDIAANTQPEVILGALWAIIPSIHTWGRLQTAEKEVVADVMCLNFVAPQLAAKIVQSTAGPAASILSQAGRRSSLDASLKMIASSAIQPAVRAKAYKSLLEGRAVWVEGRKWTWTDKIFCKGRYEPVLGERPIHEKYSIAETFRDAIRDKSPAVRKVAGDALIAKRELLGADAMPLAKALSGDSYPSIAERGQYVVDRLLAER